MGYNANVDISLSKKSLREAVKKRILTLSEAEKEEAAKRIFEALSVLSVYKTARSVMAYASTIHEVDTSALLSDVLRRGHALWLPWCETGTRSIFPVRIRDLKNDLTPGAYGILSPREPDTKVIPPGFHPSLIFVPGVAFDKKGNRLGRGLGYYDKFLAALPAGTIKMGLAFDCQVEETMPTESFDQRLDRVISG